MKLTYEKLIKFDLIEEVERFFSKMDKLDLFMEAVGIFSGIQKIDEFIKDSPSFPGSTDKIIRSELVSVVGATLAIEGTYLAQDEIADLSTFGNAFYGLGREKCPIGGGFQVQTGLWQNAFHSTR